MIIKYAPVVPVKIAKAMKSCGLLGDYHLLLAHDVVKHPKQYAEIYRGSAHDDDSNFIIMDNSVVELNKPVDYTMLLDAGEIVKADCIVLPDHLLDKQATIDSTIEAYERLHKLWTRDYMVLPQGSDFKQWAICASELMKFRQFKYVGIPRNIREKLGWSRTVAIQVLSALNIHKGRKFHLFGFSDDLWDDILSCHRAQELNFPLMGIDSTVPVRQGCQGNVISLFQGDPGPRGDWWNKPGDLSIIAKMNVERVREWINLSHG